jgi:hypothetical protein
LLDGGRNLPRRRRCKPRHALAVAAGAVALTACGAGGDELRTVEGPGFAFSAPADWEVTRRGRSSSAASPDGSPDVVSVTVFRLARPYEPDQWAEVVPELDRVAGQLAAQLDGRLVARSTVTVAGRRARSYDIEYVRGEDRLVERTAFVLDDRREYQLVCRHAAGEAPDACDTLFETFRIS